jgi:hypothetical protein
MGINIGSLFASLTLQSSQFTQGTRQAAQSANTMATSINSSFGSIVKAGAAAFGAFKVGEMLIGAAKSAFEYAASLKELSQQTGVTVEQYQILGRAALANGVQQDTMNTAMKRLNSTLGEAQAGSEEAIKKFKQLGISKEQINSFQQAGDIMPYVMEGIKNVGDAAKQAAAAKQLFGKAAGDLLPVLTQGAQGYNVMAEEARKAGLLTAEQADKADDAADKVGLLAQTLKTKLAIALTDNLPAINAVIDGLAGIIQVAGQAISWLSKLSNESEVGNLERKIRVNQALVDGALVSPEEKAAAGKRLADAKRQLFFKNLPLLPEGVHGRSTIDVNIEKPHLDLSKGGGGAKHKGAGTDPLKAGKDMIDNLKFQDEQLQKTGADLEVFNNLHQVGAASVKAMGKEIETLTRKLYDDKALKEWNDQLEKGIKEAQDATALAGLSGEALDAAKDKFYVINNRPKKQGGDGNTITGQKGFTQTEQDYLDSKAAERAAERKKNVDEYLKDLQFERDQLKRTDEEQYIYNALKEHGADATAEQKAQIEAVAKAYYEEEQALQKIKDQQQEIKEAAGRFADIGIQMFDGLIHGTKSWSEVFKNTIESLGDLMLEELVYRPMKEMLANLGNKLFSSLLGGGSGGGGIGGILGSLIGGSGYAFGASGGYDAANASLVGGLAGGGPVKAGGSYWVGERGPELFRASSSGRIIPNSQVGRGNGMVLNIDARHSTNPAETKRQVMQGIMEATPQIVQQSHAYTMNKLTRPHMN